MKKIITIILTVGVLGLLLVTTVMAQADNFTIPWWRVAGGGGESSGGSYHLDGIIGQPEAHQASHGGSFTLVGGFWGASPTIKHNYLPLVTR